MVTTGHWGRHGKAIGAALIGGAMLIGPGSGAVQAQQAPVVVAPQAVPPVAMPGSEETVLWELARRRGTVEALRSFLSTYPNGQYAPEARALLGQLQAGTPAGSTLGTAAPAAQTPTVTPAPDLPAGVSPADAARGEVLGTTPPASTPPTTGSGAGGTTAATEAALGLSRDARIGIQRGLVKAGYDTRGVDGQFGSGTRRAISQWQQARGYAATGYLNAAQAEELRISGRPGGGEGAGTLAAADVEAALELSSTQRRIIQSRLTQMGHDTNGVDGKFGSGTRRAITAWQRGAGVSATGYLTRADADAILNAGTAPVVVPGVDADAAARTELALNLTREDRMAAQRGLVRAGHDTRGVDGAFGSGTRRAIRAWQVSRGEPATGYLTRAQFDVLKGSGGTAPVVVGGGATAADEAGLNLGAVERTEVQTRLAALGYDPRGIDGKFGPGTRRAISAWQGDNGLTATGYLNRDQLARLRSQRRN